MDRNPCLPSKAFTKQQKCKHTMNRICCCSVTQACPTLCAHMDCSMPGFPDRYHLLEIVQAHVHRVGDAIQPSHPLSSPSPESFPASGSFPVSWQLTSAGQCTGAAACRAHQTEGTACCAPAPEHRSAHGDPSTVMLQSSGLDNR